MFHEKALILMGFHYFCTTNLKMRMKAIKLTVLAAAMVVAGSNLAKAQNADEIIQKHIDAIGGTANWNKVSSMKLTGSMNVQGMEINVIQTVLNDKGMRLDISVMGSDGYNIITPTGGWSYMPFTGVDSVIALPAEQLKAAKGKLNMKTSQLVDKAQIGKAEYIGKDTMNSVACYKLKVTDKEGNIQTCYIDAATYYMVRAEAKVKVKDEEIEDGVTFSNFQKQQGGIVMPTTFSTSQGEITFKTIEVNNPVDEKIFKPTKKK
jgi:hypothetical protein